MCIRDSKNGVDVGTIYKTVYSSGVKVAADVDFLAGDKLEVFVPVFAEGGPGEPINISIIGGLI